MDVIPFLVELAEDFDEVICYAFVADYLAFPLLSVAVNVQYAEIAQVVSSDIAVLRH